MSSFAEWIDGDIPEFDDGDFVGGIRDVAEVSWRESRREPMLMLNYLLDSGTLRAEYEQETLEYLSTGKVPLRTKAKWLEAGEAGR